VKSRLVIIVFAIGVVFATAVSVYMSYTVNPVQKTIVAVPSPDGRYKAVVMSLSHGGSAPFCYDTISIYLAAYPNDFVESEQGYQVYWSTCATPANPADTPAVKWLANNEAQITYTQGPTPADPRKLRKRVVDASQFVKITYVERK
jgi:hypothetical protein